MVVSLVPASVGPLTQNRKQVFKAKQQQQPAASHKHTATEVAIWFCERGRHFRILN